MYRGRRHRSNVRACPAQPHSSSASWGNTYLTWDFPHVASGREGPRPSPRGQQAHLSPVNRTPNRRWFWRFMLVFGVALAIDFFVDDKLVFAGIALIWILACFFTLSKLRRPRHAP